MPALSNSDEKVVGGLACLLSEIGQAVSVDIKSYIHWHCILQGFNGSCMHERFSWMIWLYSSMR